MTREEAIEILSERYLNAVSFGADDYAMSVNEALDMAISALKEEPLSHEEAWEQIENDRISRADAVALVIKAIHGTDNEEIKEYLFRGLRKQMWVLPSADRPTQKYKLNDGTEKDLDEESYEIGYTNGQRADRPMGEWIDHSEDGYVECPFCEHATNCDGNIEELHYCFWCGAYMKGGAK